MKRNMSSADRILRAAVVAVALVVVGIVIGALSVLGIVLSVVAAVMVATAAIGVCPLYTLIGFNTCGRTVGAPR